MCERWTHITLTSRLSGELICALRAESRLKCDNLTKVESGPQKRERYIFLYRMNAILNYSAPRADFRSPPEAPGRMLCDDVSAAPPPCIRGNVHAPRTPAALPRGWVLAAYSSLRRLIQNGRCRRRAADSRMAQRRCVRDYCRANWRRGACTPPITSSLAVVPACALTDQQMR